MLACTCQQIRQLSIESPLFFQFHLNNQTDIIMNGTFIDSYLYVWLLRARRKKRLTHPPIPESQILQIDHQYISSPSSPRANYFLHDILQEFICKLEVCFAAIHPCSLIVEEAIRPLLIFIRDILGLFVALKPCLVLFMESPALLLQRFGRQVLLVRVLPIVEDVEQRIGVYLRIHSRVIEYV